MKKVKPPPQIFYVNTERELGLAAAIISNLKPTEDKPWVITVGQDDESRSLKQNRLSFAWYKFLGEATGHGAAYERAYYKLVHGVPLLRPDKDYNKFYQAALAHLDFNQQLDCMDFVPVTSQMTVKQFAEYLNTIEHQAGSRGIVLPRPDDLYWAALMKEAEKC